MAADLETGMGSMGSIGSIGSIGNIGSIGRMHWADALHGTVASYDLWNCFRDHGLMGKELIN